MSGRRIDDDLWRFDLWLCRNYGHNFHRRYVLGIFPWGPAYCTRCGKKIGAGGSS